MGHIKLRNYALDKVLTRYAWRASSSGPGEFAPNQRNMFCPTLSAFSLSSSLILVLLARTSSDIAAQSAYWSCG
jgi:hypothetical protein